VEGTEAVSATALQIITFGLLLAFIHGWLFVYFIESGKFASVCLPDI
jgi:hypothetical protein